MKANMARRFGPLWKPQLFAGVILGYLLGRALPGTQVAPFGVAFYAAVRAAGFRGPEALPVALAVMAGSLGLQPGFPREPWVVLSVVLCHLL
ncbi:MAG TPA: hypothetical protein VD902_08905, partial [Symbiobacteriaceae bacterium]|nr:hypothetical protein [Symbiobacteriaceae bacterium]